MTVVTPVKDITLAELIEKYDLSVSAQVFLNTTDTTTESSNWDRIKRQYSAKELKDNEPKYPGDTVLIKSGTKIELRNSFLKRDKIQSPPPDVIETAELKPFLVSRLAELMQDPKYTQSVRSYSGEQIANITNNDITVYIWCRGLTAPNSTAQEGSWLNVSAFVENLNTEKGEVGSFSLTLPPVACEWSEFYGWQLSKDVVGYDTGSVRDEVTSVITLLKSNPRDPGFYWREKFLFNTVLQENDLVYIRFEKLELDEELNTRLREVSGRLGNIDIPNRTYDMIGLVDDVSIRTSPSNAQIQVSGRDLMKVLIEDGSLFFPEQFAQDIFTNPDSILTKRNKIELVSQSLAGASYTFKTVQTILKFIFNKFSNIGFVPNSVFNGYGDRAIRRKYQLKSSAQKSFNGDVMETISNDYLNEDRQGVWRIIEFVFDPQVANRVLADNSISQDNGSILNSIQKICQQPFVQFEGDTYKDKFYFFIRKQPFDKKGYRGLVYSDFVTENEGVSSHTIVGKDDLQKANTKQIIERRLALTGRPSTISDLVIDIDDVDVIGEPNLSYHDEVYSWYRIIPRGLGITNEDTAFQFAPAIPFDEYAEIWGNKALSMEYNYAPSEYLKDSESNRYAKYAEAQTFRDLQFLVQSHQYLPFARRGRITLTGNRTIKRGLFVFLKSTQEIFYVDSVSHSRSISGLNNRTTTLTVSRGLREKYIKGVMVNFPTGPKKVSYFDIINTEIANNASLNNKEFLKNWRVDKDIFNFFVQRRQWFD